MPDLHEKATFEINWELLAEAGRRLTLSAQVFWVVGGAGSGKTTVCQLLSQSFGLPLYDMDARIYGSYHGRFTPQRHPVNWAWSSSPDALAYLLGMTWEQFDCFNRAALPEYLDLLAEDLAGLEAGRVMVDGGICNPSLLARHVPTIHLVGLAVAGSEAGELWESQPGRLEMKEAVYRLAQPERAWQKFLEFDRRLTNNIQDECKASGIPLHFRKSGESPEQSGEQAAALLGLMD